MPTPASLSSPHGPDSSRRRAPASIRLSALALALGLMAVGAPTAGCGGDDGDPPEASSNNDGGDNNDGDNNTTTINNTDLNNNINNEVAPDDGETSIVLDRRFSTEPEAACNMASPVVYRADDGATEILMVTVTGALRAYDAESGQERWRFQIDAVDGEVPVLLATPALVGDRLFLSWTSVRDPGEVPDQGKANYRSHHMEALDLTTQQWDPDFPRLTYAATATTVDGEGFDFIPRLQKQRGEIKHIPGGDLGFLYAPFGAYGYQPYHGWLFEVDLDAWRDQGADAAFSSVWVSTRGDAACEYEGIEGASYFNTCGGGLWAPPGPYVSHNPDGTFELIIGTGNGNTNIQRQEFGHSIVKLQAPGLGFTDGCDVDLCEGVDEDDPDRACIDSCENVYIPRMPEGETFMPEEGFCDGQTLIECYATLDLDFGSSSPIDVELPSGRRVVVHAAKDGALYLIDREHLGDLLHRVQIIESCGSPQSPCPATWAGQFVTQPVTTEIDGDVVVIASGFNWDAVHPAGVVAYRVTDADPPQLEPMWEVPEFDTADATIAFRRHTGRPVIYTVDGEPFVMLVETIPGNDGRIWVIRVRDGRLMQRIALESFGVRYSKPAIVGDRLFVGTCGERNAQYGGALEAFDIAEGEAEGDNNDTGPDVTEGTPCTMNGAICADNEYCNRPACGHPGFCEPRPDTCEGAEAATMCGCDDVTYESVCDANAAGVDADPGACP